MKFTGLRFTAALMLLTLVFSSPTAAESVNQHASQQTSPAPISQTDRVSQTSPAAASTTGPANTNAPAQPFTEQDRIPFMAESNRATAEQQAPSTGGLLLRTFGALLLIVGLIVAGSWGLSRFGGARFGAPSTDAPHLSVLNSVSLGDRRSLAVVRFGTRTLLIGSTAQSITLIADEDSEIESPHAPPVRSVAEMLEDESGAFEEELTIANRRISQTHQVWSNDGGNI